LGIKNNKKSFFGFVIFVIFISIFDEKSDSERVLDFFRPGSICYFSKDIEKELKIKSLSKTLTFDF
jgi:hypothetical protein